MPKEAHAGTPGLGILQRGRGEQELHLPGMPEGKLSWVTMAPFPVPLTKSPLQTIGTLVTLRWNKYSVCPHDKHGSVASGCLQTPPCSSPQRPGYILQRHQCSWTPVRPDSGAVKPLRTEVRWAGCRQECCVPCICFPDYSTEGLAS